MFLDPLRLVRAIREGRDCAARVDAYPAVEGKLRA
jgi:hypothetical protein